MISSKHSTFPPAAVFDYLEASTVIDHYLEDLLLPAFNQLRAAYGIEPASPPNRPPVTLEEAAAAGKKYKAYWNALRAQEPREPRAPHMPTLAGVAKQAAKAGIDVSRYEVKPDGTVVVITGTPEPATPDDPWPLDEFRTKDIKQ
jgi:hypothetical protein